jgi:hypothetical protein
MMARFQALTNPLLDQELDRLRQRLGLEPSQKAELLREVAALASWLVQQSEQGRVIEARRGEQVEPLRHPMLEHIREQNGSPIGPPLQLTDEESGRLAEALEGSFRPSPALRQALANLGSAGRKPPKLRWKKTA